MKITKIEVAPDEGGCYNAKVIVLEEGKSITGEANRATPEEAVRDAISYVFFARQQALQNSVVIQISVKLLET